MTTRFIDEKEMPKLTRARRVARTKPVRYIVTRKNEPIFELRPLTKKDAKLEKFMRDIEAAREDVRAGRVYTQAQVEKILGI